MIPVWYFLVYNAEIPVMIRAKSKVLAAERVAAVMDSPRGKLYSAEEWKAAGRRTFSESTDN